LQLIRAATRAMEQTRCVHANSLAVAQLGTRSATPIAPHTAMLLNSQTNLYKVGEFAVFDMANAA
jgi:hypothetical protein